MGLSCKLSLLNNNIDYTYLKKNIVSILFQSWFSPMLLMSFISGSYYENNNDYKNIEYIRNYECINLLLEFFYFNQYVIRSSMFVHHVIAIIIPHTFLVYHNLNMPFISAFVFITNITITTNFLLDAAKVFHNSSLIKVIFVIYYFIVRIIFPLRFLFNITTGHYLYFTPSEYIPLLLFISSGAYAGYGLNVFWFYKIVRIAKKLMNSNNISTLEKHSQISPHQPDVLPPCEQNHINTANHNTSRFVYVPCGH